MEKRIHVIVAVLIMVLLGILPSYAALQYQETYTSVGGANKTLVVVNSAIYDAIYAPFLKQYISDLESENYNVTLTKFISGTSAELKAYIKVFFTSLNLRGVVFIGDLPNVYFEIANDHDQYGYQSFPIDLFYTDLDGAWQDTDNNGIYETHTAGSGTLGPEVWLGRLTASPIYNPAMDEVAILKNYFVKNHSYRTGKLIVIQRGLSYPDDDWSYFNDCDLSLIYGSDVTIVNDVNLTTAADYKSKLAADYEWVHVCVHSNPSLHAFYENNRVLMSYVYNNDIRTIDPKAVFYNLFACSNADYDAYNYMGGNYIFAKTNGLAAVGSTKIGSMLYFDYFYSHLGINERNSLGEAFKLWFRNMNLSNFGQECWFYGMTLLGDPTLTLDPPIASIDFLNSALVYQGQAVEFRGSGKISNGIIAAYSWRSNIDGYLNGNSSFITTLLSTGEHTIYFKVQDNKYRWSSEVETKISVNPDSTVSTTPIVTDEGANTSSASVLKASWTCSDAESGIAEYQYSITQDSTTGAVIKALTSTGITPSVTATGLTLLPGKIYYFSVKAKNGAGLWSSVGYSDGITVNNNVNVSPQVGAVTPASGTSNANQAVNFTTTYTDANGWQDIQYGCFLINTLVSGVNCLSAYYDQNSNKLYLRNNANTVWLGGYAPGTSNVIENSYVKLDCAATTVQGTGNTLTVNWSVAFKSTFTGTKNTYLYAKDDANAYASGWSKLGVWTIQ